MSNSTSIEWTDATWNPVRGCSRVSEGCRNCYAERVAARLSDPGMPYHGLAHRVLKMAGLSQPRWTGEVKLIPDHLADPLRWKKPKRIFVNSMSDLFHEKLSNWEIAAVFGVMAAAQQHTFQVLTKRAKQRLRQWFAWVASAAAADGATPAAFCFALAQARGVGERPREVVDRARGAEWPLPNVWLGVSVENQAAADDRIPELLATPAAVRFLSCDPLISEVDLDLPRCDDQHHGESEWSVTEDAMPWCNECDEERSYGHWLHLDGGIDWVIAGCESGPGARPCDVAWLRSLRDQCDEAEVPFFLKQARGPGAENSAGPDGVGRPAINHGIASKLKPGGVYGAPYLDGKQHLAFPVVQ